MLLMQANACLSYIFDDHGVVAGIAALIDVIGVGVDFEVGPVVIQVVDMHHHRSVPLNLPTPYNRGNGLNVR